MQARHRISNACVPYLPRGVRLHDDRVRGIRVLLCGMETPPSKGWTYTLDFHRLFPRVADRYGIPLVPFLLAGVALDPAMNGEDGFHPNSAGARRIAETVWPYLAPLVLAPTAVSR